MNKTLAAAAAVALVTSSGMAQKTLETVFSGKLIVNGPTVSHDGRLFFVVQPNGEISSPQVFEVHGGVAAAYPNERWNSWKPGEDGHKLFVGVNSIRMGPDGALWVVDRGALWVVDRGVLWVVDRGALWVVDRGALWVVDRGALWVVDRGAPGMGEPLAPGGPKLIRIDIGKNQVTRAFDLPSVTTPWSFVDDVRFKDDIAYLTDAGNPGLIVLDLHSGFGRRVLEGHPSTVAQSPMVAEGKALRNSKGDPVNIHADQLEVFPNGKYSYYQPSWGRMSRIETAFLDDAKLSDAQLAMPVERFADTPPTGGTAIGADGTIYLSDVDESRILTISPEGNVSELLSDPRLTWVDAMWIDDAGYLLMPAAQLNRTAGMNGGVSAVQDPITVYKVFIGQSGVRR